MHVIARLGLVLAILLSLGSAGVQQPIVAHAACANPVACENALTGNPRTQWDISGSGDASIQGLATDISYNVGDTAVFKINTPAAAYTIDIYRLGYYAGNGARLISSITPSATLPQTQPACLTDATTGLVDCGNWAASASWAIPSTAVSGIYIAKLTRPDTGGASHIPFIVRNDASTSDLLFQTSDTTWQAYNQYGGNSLYQGTAPSSDGRAYRVSYNRPIVTRGQSSGFGTSDYLFYAEYPMLRFLEANGYDLSYTTDLDSDRRGTLIRNHKAFLSVGHDEYWSPNQRANVEGARDAGVNLAFFSGNLSYWKVRWENSIDGSGTTYRTLVTYKETAANTPIDPLDPTTWTGTWRDPRFSPPADGGRPENAMSGTIFTVDRGSGSLQVPAADGRLRIWRNTAVANQSAGQVASLSTNVIGYEWDQDVDNGFRPAGLFHASTTPLSVTQYIADYGSTFIPSTATHSITEYRAASGALVFSAGTVQWSWGLDPVHDTNPDSGAAAGDPNLQQATVNVLADMGAQPTTLMTGLLATATSTDMTPPSSSIVSPAAASHVTIGSTVTVSGTAADTGGVVGGVEVSTDGGVTWHPASGRENWTYTWNVGSAPGTVTLKTRAADDSGNLETPGAGIAVTVDGLSPSCNCTLWGNSATPLEVDANDPQAVELGLKFRSDISGFIAGLRFYKSAANTGTHVGNLWSSTGTLLASATFTNETVSGWQQVAFSAPVAIAANTTYVASYHTNVGHYSADPAFFGYAGTDTYPLHALKSGVDGPNAVYRYSAGSAFPNQSVNPTNYWVTPVFNVSTTDTTPPTVTTFTPASTASGISLVTPVTATFSEDVQPTTIGFTLTDPTGASVAGTTTYTQGTTTATFQPSGPLALATSYTATVSGVKDLAGNLMSAPASWTISTPACPCSLWSNATTPGTVDANDASAVEVGTRFRTHVAGYVTDIRFYKGPTNTGTHTGHLWTSAGALLASVTFASETASGWQQATLSAPVSVAANTDYIVSYHTDTGNYAADGGYFGTSATDVGPLDAMASATGASNGVFIYGASAFPNQTFNATNYWVDALFNTSPGGAPPVISGVQATQIASGGATIVWTTNVATDGLVEYGATTSYGSSSPLNTTLITSHSIQLSGLNPSTIYHYRVKSKDSAGTLSTSGDFTFTTSSTVDTTPPVLSAIQAGAITYNAATITWTTNEPADTQVAYGLTTAYGSSTTLNTTLVTSHSQAITGLTPSTLYHYQVKSKDASGNLATSADFSFTTTADTTPPVISAVQASQITTSGAAIGWTTDEPADSQVKYGTTTAYGSTTTLDSNLLTSHAQTLAGLLPNTLYHYQVLSKDAFGNLAASADATFTTLADTTPPVISAVAASGLTSNSATITWTTNEASDSQVDYGTTTAYGSSSTLNTSLVTSHSVGLSGLAPATTYHYRVDSRDASGNLARSTDATFTTPADTTPPGLSAIQATNLTSTSATITWTSSEPATTQVDYGTTTLYGTSSPLNSSLVTIHSVTLSNLAQNTTYHYRVKSADASGNLSTSGDFTFITARDTTPPVISAVAAGSITTSGATMTWTTDELSDSQVDYGLTTAYGTSSALNSTLVTSHSVAVTGLAANTLYHYRVKSKDAYGNLAVSADFTFTTLQTPHSLAFNATTAYAEAPNATEINVVGNWTVEAWFRDQSANYNHKNTTMLVKGDTSTDAEVPFALGINTNALYVAQRTGGVTYALSYDLNKAKVSINTWHHVAATLNGSTRQVTLYLDGVQVVQGTYAAITSVGNSKPVEIGRNGATTSGSFWNGKLDDVRIWNVVRTASQISAAYRAELTGTQTGLVGNWKFDEGTGSTAADVGGTPQNATLVGGYTWSTDVHP